MLRRGFPRCLAKPPNLLVVSSTHTTEPSSSYLLFLILPTNWQSAEAQWPET